jgi:hypothetical protein
MPYPSLPPDLSALPVFSVTASAFIVDDMAGQLFSHPSSARMSRAQAASVVQAQADTVAGLIANMQGDGLSPGTNGGVGFYSNSSSFGRHQAFPRTSQRQLNSECRGDQNVYFPRLDFLEIARGNFSFFGQLLLRRAFTHPFATDVCAKHLDSLPLFFGKRHGILHRIPLDNMNDTTYREICQIFIASPAPLI